MKGGTLEFDIVANNDGINKALNETEKRITGFSKATVEGGKSIDAMFDATNENIRIQKQVVKELESEYAKLEKEIKRVAPGNGRYPLQQQANAVKAEIEAEKNALTQLEGAVKKNEAAHVSLRTQLRNCVQQLAEMEQAGLRGTDAYKKLQAETGRLTDALGDAQTQAKILAHDNAGLQGVISAVSGVAGAFSTAQGTIGLFAGENENLQKIMVKVQSLMAITIGLQQVANTLNKDSYFRIVTLTKAKNLFAAATTRSSAALVKFGLSAGAANIAAKALVGTLTLGLSVAIGVAVAAINRINAKREEAQRKLKEQIELESDARAEMIKTRFELETTMRSIKNFTGTKDEEKQKVEELNRKYGDSFGTYKTLADWYDTLSKKAEDYIQILFLQAKVQSLVSKALEADLKVQEVKATNADDLEDSMGWVAKFGLYMAQSESSGNFDASAAITEHNEEAKEAAVKAAEDIRDGYLKEAEKLQEEIQKLITEFNAGKVTATTTGTNNSKDPFITQLETRKAAHEAYNKWVKAGLGAEANVFFNDTIGDGDSYIQYLEKLKTETTLTKEQLAKVNSEIADVAIATQQTQLADFETELQNQLSGAQNIMQMLDILEQRRNALSGDGSDLDNAKSSAIDKQAEEVAKQAEEQTQALLEQYAGYLGKKIALELELTNDLQLLETRRAKAATETDKEAIDDIIKNRKAQYNEDKANLLYAGYEATRGIIDLAQDKALLSISNKAFMWESDRKKSVLETQKQAEEKTLEELQKIYREAPTEAIALEIEKVNLKIEELNAELEKMPKAKFQEMLSGFQKITSALGNLDGAVGEIFSNISREVDNLKVAFDDTATKTDKVSAGIAAVVDIINMVSSASEERKRKEKEFYNAALAFAHEYTLTLNEQLRLQSELSDSVFITDYQAKINSAFAASTEAASKYDEALAKLSEGTAKTGLRNAIDWGNVGIGAAAGAAAGAAIGSIVPVIGTAIGAVVGGAIGAIAGLFGGKKKKETFGGLLEVFPELVDSAGNLNKAMAQSLIASDQLDDKTKKLVQNALDWAEAVEAANEQIREVVVDLAGDLGNNIRNSIVEAWKAGEDASKRMFEVAGESLEKFIEQLVYSTLFSDIFKDFENELAASLDPIAGDGDVIDDYDRLMDRLDEREGLYTAALEAIRQRAKERGFDLWGNNDNTDPSTSLSGAIKGASQESINLLAGQTNAVRVNQIVSIDLLREQLVALTGIYDRVGTSNRFLEAIERNTAASNYDPLRAQGIRL